MVWNVEDFLKEETARVSVPLENRRVELRAWRYNVKGVRGFEVPVYFLDADPSNANGTATSPAAFMAAIPITACARKSCLESAACGCCTR